MDEAADGLKCEDTPDAEETDARVHRDTQRNIRAAIRDEIRSKRGERRKTV